MRIKETIRYIADDGKVFEDEDECFLYEYHERLRNSSLLMLEEVQNGSQPPRLVPTDDPSCACYIEAKTDEDLSILRMWQDYDGAEVPIFKGNWYYDDKIDKWRDMDEMTGLIASIAVAKSVYAEKRPAA